MSTLPIPLLLQYAEPMLMPCSILHYLRLNQNHLKNSVFQNICSFMFRFYHVLVSLLYPIPSAPLKSWNISLFLIITSIHSVKQQFKIFRKTKYFGWDGVRSFNWFFWVHQVRKYKYRIDRIFCFRTQQNTIPNDPFEKFSISNFVTTSLFYSIKIILQSFLF